MADRAYSGGWWGWLTPFSLTVGLALMPGYMLLGATWLAMKTKAGLQEHMRRRAWILALATVARVSSSGTATVSQAAWFPVRTTIG